ncbi:MAG: EamA family transporter RarD [Planctomycetota bacterium]
MSAAASTSTPSSAESARQLRIGLSYGLAAYAFWALVFPLQIAWLNAEAPADATANPTRWSIEVLGHRLVWSLALCVVLIRVRGQGSALRQAFADRRLFWRLVATAILMTGNWLIFLLAISRGELYRAGIGYFLTPMVHIVLGITFLGERLRRFQAVAVGSATLGVGYLMFLSGELPWIELGLALFPGFYGLLRKGMSTGPLVGFTVESILLFPAALAVVIYMSMQSDAPSGFIEGSLTTKGLLVLTGIGTALPLIWFAAAALRLPLVTIGVLHFLAPTGQFLLGVLAFGQRPPEPEAWFGYAAIWLGALMLVGQMLSRRDGS